MLSVIISGHCTGTSLITKMSKGLGPTVLCPGTPVGKTSATHCALLLQLETEGHGVRDSESSANNFFLNLRFENHPLMLV